MACSHPTTGGRPAYPTAQSTDHDGGVTRYAEITRFLSTADTRIVSVPHVGRAPSPDPAEHLAAAAQGRAFPLTPMRRRRWSTGARRRFWGR